MIHTKHYAVFLSPGMLFPEESIRPVSKWDTIEACAELSSIVERHCSNPYAFYFITLTESDPIDDGTGGTLDVVPKRTAKSCMYHINGKFESTAEIESRGLDSERILLSNLKSVNSKGVVITTNSWKHHAGYVEGDQFVDSSGNILPLPEELS